MHAPMGLLHRLLAILLLAVFSLPLALPAFTAAQGGEAGLPACCRRNGAHHCAMSMAERAGLLSDAEMRWRTPLERCPFCPATAANPHPTTLAPPTEGSVLLPASSSPLAVRAAQCTWRVARERARHKRGPPQTAFA